MPQAVVTGCGGFIGSHLVDRLLRGGHAVVGIDRRGTEEPEVARNLAWAIGQPRFSFFRGDLLETDLEHVLAGAQWVFHLAGRTGGWESWGDGFDACVRDNVTATQRLLDAALRTQPGRFIHASAAAVYGDDKLPMREKARLQPGSPYGVTKLAAEHLVRLYGQQYGLPHVILRLFTVYGPRQRPDMAFRRMMEQVRRHESVTVHGDGQQSRDLIYVDDVVRALVRAAKADRAQGQVINIGGGEPVTVNQAVALLQSQAGRPTSVEHAAAPLGEMTHTQASLSRAKELLDWEPRTPLEEGLRQQWIWLDLAPALARRAGLEAAQL